MTTLAFMQTTLPRTIGGMVLALLRACSLLRELKSQARSGYPMLTPEALARTLLDETTKAVDGGRADDRMDISYATVRSLCLGLVWLADGTYPTEWLSEAVVGHFVDQEARAAFVKWRGVHPTAPEWQNLTDTARENWRSAVRENTRTFGILREALQRVARGRVDCGRPLAAEDARQIAREALHRTDNDW